MAPRRLRHLPVAVLAAFVVFAAFAAGAPSAHATGGALAQEPGSVGGVAAGEALPVPAPTAARTGGQSADSQAAAPMGALVAPTGPILAADVPHGPLIAVTARRYGLPVALFTALVWQESGFNERARSKAGARGLTQLMPGTARELGVRRVYDPVQNLDGGARYLRAQLLRFAGSKGLALAAYNAGPASVVKHKGIPPFAETRRYVASILALEARLTLAGVR
jgi:soluble lytic murein transglycosylase-like protein